jgi:hypothetical protein
VRRRHCDCWRARGEQEEISRRWKTKRKRRPEEKLKRKQESVESAYLGHHLEADPPTPLSTFNYYTLKRKRTTPTARIDA